MALTIQQVKEILDDEFLNHKTPQGIQGGDAQQIHLPFDPLGQKFYERYQEKIKIKLPEGILTNHSGRKTATQILQDADISEDAIMNVMGHKSVQGVRAYKHINEHQQINTMQTLVSTIETLRNSNKINQVSSAEFNGSHGNINVNTNTISTQNINMIQGEFQNQ
ncbi:11551_t:CDS:2, partial [Gigaspora rosea]